MGSGLLLNKLEVMQHNKDTFKCKTERFVCRNPLLFIQGTIM